MATVPSPDDLWDAQQASKKLKGIFANQIFVQPLSGAMVRLNFGEVLDVEPTYHTAIVLTAAEAMSFAELIFRVAKTSAEAALAGPGQTPTSDNGTPE